MSAKAAIAAVRALHTRKGRNEHGRFIVQGATIVQELLRSGWPVHALHATAEAAHRLGLRQATIWPPHVLERMGSLESGNELVAVVPLPPPAPPPTPARNELIIALDGIADPGNLGTVLRIADWFGVRHVLCATGSVDAYNPKCVQAGMGAFLRVTAHTVDLPAELQRLRGLGATLYPASMEGRNVFEVRLQRPAVLVLGNEAHGLSEPVRALGGTLVAVPRVGRAESLNVAMAAAALCMEFARRG